MRVNSSIRPQDIAVLLKLLVHQDSDMRQIDLATQLFLSPGEINNALNRAVEAGLLSADKRLPICSALKEFLIHGVRYVFPVKPGKLVRGLPTGASAAILSKEIHNEVPFVWPTELGDVDGQAIVPLYPELPKAALQDEKLYLLLTLVDALRMGRARDSKIAAKELEKQLNG